jgi:hypothetical protein
MDLMTYRDGNDREMTKWAHQRLDTARRRAEEDFKALVDWRIILLSASSEN